MQARVSTANPRHRIDRLIYVDDEIYHQEMEKIFARTWQYVGHANELKRPGDFLCAAVGGQPIVICRDDDLALRAFFNTCAHRGAELTSKRRGNVGKVFRCMFHGWSYDLRGRLIGVPYRDAYGASFETQAHGLAPASVQTFSGMMFVSLDPQVESVEAYLGEAAPYLKKYCENTEVIGRIRWIYDGNWKLWQENFADNYHPEFTHRWVRDAQWGYADEGENRQLDSGHGLLTWPQKPLFLDRLAAGLKEASGLEVDPSKNPEYAFPPFPIKEEEPDVVLSVFPNLDLQYFAGGAAIIIQIKIPLAVDRTLVELLSLAPVDEAREARQWRLERSAGIQATSGKITADDAEALGRCQRGMAARAVRWSNMERGQEPGKAGKTRDEYSLRSFYAGWEQYMSRSAAAIL
ncbi:MAG TPA: aromatic ring-hydroxylating dioxygenase subunit alpha [Candidatus Binataceae bacterium]|nr:aromatic ring-hydroxylating dioxygenase subunit alpha [Candidatus Binataceae bacterium]